MVHPTSHGKLLTGWHMHNSDSSRLPVRALIFLAAPHRGMNVDVLRSVVKNEPPKQLIEELAPDSPTLKEINVQFMEISRDIDILTCLETLKTKTLVWNVSGDFSSEETKKLELEGLVLT